MNSCLSQCDKELLSLARSVGAAAIAIVDAAPVDEETVERTDRWLADGSHGTMAYLEKYRQIRNDPRLLLDGAQSLICVAFPYYDPLPQDADALNIALFARGDDYHEVVSRRLKMLATFIKEKIGGETRACVDTAPLRERYWAERAGLGFIGRNDCLIMPGAGSFFFIGVILTTVKFRETAMLLGAEDKIGDEIGAVRMPDLDLARMACRNCGRCVKACPVGAIAPEGFRIDARRCIAYLTIEHRGDFPEDTDLHGHFYGCDECQKVCPHNAFPPVTTIQELKPRPSVRSLTAEKMENMTQEEFSEFFRRSPMKRAKLAGLLRNLRQLQKNNEIKK